MRDWISTRSWCLLLILLLVTLVFDTLQKTGPALEIVSRAAYMLVFAGTALTADISGWARRLAIGLVLLWPIATLLNNALLMPVTEVLEIAVLALLLVGGLVIVFREVSREDGRMIDATPAAIFGFLLIALVFALFYVKLEEVCPGSFHLEATDGDMASMLYFSLVTITTLGFGDITPASRLARVLVGLQAATGLMYVAVFIGRAVRRE
jgi:hypothetical protein